MSKYIVDTDDYLFDFKGILGVGLNSDMRITFKAKPIEEMEQLNASYVRKHFEDELESAFAHGRTEAESEYRDLLDKAKDEAYQRGLEDGKAVNDRGCEGCEYAGKVVTGPPCISCCNSYKNQWTAKSDKIEVGDEVHHVNDNAGDNCVITWVDGEDAYVMWNDGSSGIRRTENLKKTGRHYDIDSILKGLKHD